MGWTRRQSAARMRKLLESEGVKVVHVLHEGGFDFKHHNFIQVMKVYLPTDASDEDGCRAQAVLDAHENMIWADRAGIYKMLIHPKTGKAVCTYPPEARAGGAMEAAMNLDAEE
jgi:hypothetical protein